MMPLKSKSGRAPRGARLKLKASFKSNSYSFLRVGRGTVEELPRVLKRLGRISVILVADPEVSRLYGQEIIDLLDRNGLDPTLIPLKSGESVKSVRGAEALYRRLAELRVRRGTPLVALGGGVTTDLAGFVASTYTRGLPLILVPTTLLAQVDAAIGGKTGINLSQGKNLVGTFYPASYTIIDFDFLRSLPVREFRSGLSEVIKMCVLLGEKAFADLEKLAHENFDASRPLFGSILVRSIKGKARIVQKDPYEISGERAKLNLGHTFAHGLEAATRYKVYSHGEAVGIGLVAACLLTEAVFDASRNLTARIKSLLLTCGLPTRYSKVSPQEIFKAMSHDKKRTETIRFVLPLELGKVILKENVPEGLVLKVLERLREN